MRLNFKDGPRKNEVPPHVRVRLPKEIRYRVNTIQDVIGEMGYTWYCQNGGTISLSHLNASRPGAVILSGDQAFRHVAFNDIIFESCIQPGGPSQTDENPVQPNKIYAFSAGYWHAMSMYWRHFRMLYGTTPFIRWAYWFTEQPFLLPTNQTRATQYIDDFLKHADENGYLLKDPYSGPHGSATFKDRSVDTYCKLNGTAATQSGPDIGLSGGTLNSFSTRDHLVTTDGSPLKVQFKASYLGQRAAELFAHYTQTTSGSLESPALAIPIGELDARLRNSGPLAENDEFLGNLHRKSLDMVSHSLQHTFTGFFGNGGPERVPARMARWDSSVVVDNTGTSSPTSGPVPSRWHLLGDSGEANLLVPNYQSAWRLLGGSDGDFGLLGGNKSLFAHSVAGTFQTDREDWSESGITLDPSDAGSTSHIYEPFPEEGELRVILDATDPDNYLYAEMVLSRGDSVPDFDRGFIKSQMRIGRRTDGTDNILKTKTDCPMQITGLSLANTARGTLGYGASFRLLAGVRRDGSVWKLYAALIEIPLTEDAFYTPGDLGSVPSYGTPQTSLREEVEADGVETWGFEVDNDIGTKALEDRCNPKRKGGSMSNWGHAFYIVEETVSPHWGTLYGAGQRNLTDDANVRCELLAFGNPGYYVTDSEPSNNDLRTSYQNESSWDRVYSSTQWPQNDLPSNPHWRLELKESDIWFDAYRDRSKTQNPYAGDGYWVTNPQTNLTVRNEACVPYQKKGLPWRFGDMVDSLKFVLEASSPMVPGTVPCSDVTTSDEVGVKRDSPTSVTVKLSAPSGGFLAQNSPFFQKPDGCEFASMQDVTSSYEDFATALSAKGASTVCKNFWYDPKCQDNPISADCWAKDDYAVTTISTSDDRLFLHNEGEEDEEWRFKESWSTQPMFGGGNIFIGILTQNLLKPGTGERQYYGNDYFSRYDENSKPILSMSDWDDYLDEDVCTGDVFPQSGMYFQPTLVSSWPLEYTNIGFDPDEDADSDLPTACQSHGHKTADWETTHTLEGEYQLNVVPTQGYGCLDFRYEEYEQGRSNPGSFPGNAPTTFTGQFDITGIGRLTITAEFIQYCRDEQETDHWTHIGAGNSGFPGAFNTECTNLNTDFTSVDGTQCTKYTSSITNNSNSISPGTNPDFEKDAIRRPWKITAKVEYTEFDDLVGPRPHNKRHWGFSIGGSYIDGGTGGGRTDYNGVLSEYSRNTWTRDWPASAESRAGEFGVTLPSTVCGANHQSNFSGSDTAHLDEDGEDTGSNQQNICEFDDSDASVAVWCRAIQDRWVTAVPSGTSRSIPLLSNGFGSEPDSDGYDLSPIVRVADEDDQDQVAGGAWDMSIVNTSLGEFCSQTFTSSFDGFLSSLTFSSNQAGCPTNIIKNGSSDGNVTAWVPPTSRLSEDPDAVWDYTGDNHLYIERAEQAAHLYQITSYASDPFYAYHSGLWKRHGSTMTGSGIPMVTKTNYGFINQIYDVEITVAGGS